MLSVEEAKKIGINACIDKIGRDFVMQNKDKASSAYGSDDKNVFCFVGIETDDFVSENTDDVLVLDKYAAFRYRASCDVSRADGTVVFRECIVPKQ